jgi:hypothetical protein
VLSNSNSNSMKCSKFKKNSWNCSNYKIQLDNSKRQRLNNNKNTRSSSDVHTNSRNSSLLVNSCTNTCFRPNDSDAEEETLVDILKAKRSKSQFKKLVMLWLHRACDCITKINKKSFKLQKPRHCGQHIAINNPHSTTLKQTLLDY